MRILREDGTTAVHWYGLEDGAVMLEPDVREYFRDSEAVNRARRATRSRRRRVLGLRRERMAAAARLPLSAAREGFIRELVTGEWPERGAAGPADLLECLLECRVKSL